MNANKRTQGKRNRSTVMIIVAAFVVIILALAVGIYFANNSQRSAVSQSSTGSSSSATSVQSDTASSQTATAETESIGSSENNEPPAASSAAQVPATQAPASSAQESQAGTNTEDFYYQSIKAASQKQLDYINSIQDPNVKQSVQTPEGAANMQSNALETTYPQDREIILAALKRVLNGE